MATDQITSPTMWAIVIGLIPSIIWLVFWLNISREHRDPFGLIVLCFVLGGISVIFATYLQQIAKTLVFDPNIRVIVWAGIEELLKFIVFYVVAYKSYYNDRPIDPAMYLIAVALGFAALENILYVLKPLSGFNMTAGLLTGGLRFLGSTLLHAISSCFIGICISLSPKNLRLLGMILGLGGAIFLHSTFNFFIIRNDTASLLQIYGYLWITAIISHIILEKLRRFPPRVLNTY